MIDLDVALHRQDELSDIAIKAVMAADKVLMAAARDEDELNMLTINVTTLMAAKVATGMRTKILKEQVLKKNGE